MNARITRSPYSANNGDVATALRAAARWCSAAHASLAAGDLDAPALTPVHITLVAAVADPTRRALDALAAALTRWCERASSDAFDNLALAPLVLDAVDAAAACTRAVTRDEQPGAP